MKINDKSILNELYLENLVWKWSWNNEGNALKAYLNLCLVLEPFFAINWMMGVVAIENATHWSTPTIYLILVVSMVSTFFFINHHNFISLTNKCEGI